MLLTNATMFPVITVLLIFLMRLWIRSERLHYFGQYFSGQPATQATTVLTDRQSARA